MNILQTSCLCIGVFFSIAVASGQATSPTLDIRAIAEVETTVSEDGHGVVRLMPASRVVPGDEVIYTLEIRNTGSTDAVGPVITQPVPEHMAYIANTAAGPGADVTYSVDGGTTFATPAHLRVPGTGGRLQMAGAGDYTHIRWTMTKTLKAKSIAFARFRAVVK